MAVPGWVVDGARIAAILIAPTMLVDWWLIRRRERLASPPSPDSFHRTTHSALWILFTAQMGLGVIYQQKSLVLAIGGASYALFSLANYVYGRRAPVLKLGPTEIRLLGSPLSWPRRIETAELASWASTDSTLVFRRRSGRDLWFSLRQLSLPDRIRLKESLRRIPLAPSSREPISESAIRRRQVRGAVVSIGLAVSVLGALRYYGPW